MTALHWAAMRNDPAAAMLLIEAGASLDAGTRLGGHTPLHVASRSGSVSVSRMLLESGTVADVNAETTTGSTALHFAAGGGHVDVARLLLENGADADAVEAKWGQTPLVFAAAMEPGKRDSRALGARSRPRARHTGGRHSRESATGPVGS